MASCQYGYFTYPDDCYLRAIISEADTCTVPGVSFGHDYTGSYGGYRGSGSRCLAHTVETKGTNQIDISIGCLKTSCTSDVVTVTVEETDYTCTDGGTVTVDTTNFSGDVTCPTNMANFCDTSNLIYDCDGACQEGEGYCLNYNVCIEFDEYPQSEYENESETNALKIQTIL
jgi:hypothetical protein